MALVILFNFTIKQKCFCSGRLPLPLGGKAALFYCGTPCALQKHVIISYLQTLSNQKHVSIQSDSYLASNIHVIKTALEKIKTAKSQTSSLANLIHCFRNRELISLPYYFKLCSFCSKGFLLPLCALDGLRYFIVALPWPSIVTRSKKYPESSLDQQVEQASAA